MKLNDNELKAFRIFDSQQVAEIKKGVDTGVDVSLYADTRTCRSMQIRAWIGDRWKRSGNNSRRSSGMNTRNGKGEQSMICMLIQIWHAESRNKMLSLEDLSGIQYGSCIAWHKTADNRLFVMLKYP